MRGARYYLATYTPKWLSSRPRWQNAWRTLWAIAAVVDGLHAWMLQGLFAAFPGIGTPTALPLIGQSRGLVQGPNESAAAFAVRCANWRTTWANAGGDEMLAEQIQAYCQTTTKPTVSIVTRAGHWTVMYPDGSYSYFSGVPLGWDENSNPSWSTYWSDIWIIVSPPPWAVETRTYAEIAAAYPTYEGWDAALGGMGHAVPHEQQRQLAAIIQQWTPPHCNVRAIIWSYTSTNYNPANPSTIPTNGNDGSWGYGNPVAPGRPSGDVYWHFPYPWSQPL